MASARSMERPLGQFGNVGHPMHRSLNSGSQQSFFNGVNPQQMPQNGQGPGTRQGGGHAFMNADLPNGLTNLLNSHNPHPSGNGVHRMWG